MAEQDLKLRVSVDGAKQAAQDLQAVAGAQTQIGQSASASATTAAPKLEALGDAASAAATDSKKLQEEFRNFVNTLPGGERISRVIRLMNGLGDGTVSVGEAAKKAGQLLSGFSGGLKLLAAGGAVVAGIAAITYVVAKMGEEFKKATKAIEDQVAALNELKNKADERGQSIEDIAAKRKGGGFRSEDEARVANESAGRVQDRLPFVDPEAVNKATGLFGGTSESTSGPGVFTEDELARIALLIQQGRVDLDEKASVGTNERKARRALDRFGPLLDQQLSVERAQVQTASRDAKASSVSDDDESASIENFIRRRLGPGTSDDDVKKLTGLVRKSGGTIAGLREHEDVNITRDSVAIPIPGLNQKAFGGEIIEARIFTKLEEVVRALEAAAQAPRGDTIAVQRVSGIAALEDVVPVNGRTKGHALQSRGK